jgi:hypothetical protein
MPLNIKKIEEDFIISNDHYECVLSVPRGGSMTRLSYGGKDMFLKREGCEYWAKNGFHYEQEFGGRGIVGFRTQGEEIVVIARSLLVSPQGKVDGGRCVVEWRFSESPIIKSKGIITPTEEVLYFDRYVCFLPDTYEKFSHNEEEFCIEKYTEEKPYQTWFQAKDEFNVALFNKERRFTLSGKGVTNATVFHSKGMIELKITYPDQNIISVSLHGELPC